MNKLAEIVLGLALGTLVGMALVGLLTMLGCSVHPAVKAPSRPIAWDALDSAEVLVKLPDIGQGSGVVVGHNKEGRLLVLTVEHMFEGDEPGYLPPRGPKILVVAARDGMHGDARVGKLIATDRAHDLALVEVLGSLPLKPIRVSPHEPQDFDPVYQLGNVFYAAHVAATGVVSAKGRQLSGRDGTYYVITGFCWPGMSGSPVANSSGELLGLIHAVYNEDDENDVSGRVPNICWATSTPLVQKFLGMHGVLP